MKKIPSEQIFWNQHKHPVVVMIENIHSPSNMGMIIRNCEAFGIEKIIFSGPFTNKETSKFKKYSRSAENYIDIEFNPHSPSVIQSYKIRNYKVVGLEICDNNKFLTNFKLDKQSKYLIIAGSERHGIDPVTMKLMDDCVSIQQFGKTGSLNVSHALTISLYEFSKQLLN